MKYKLFLEKPINLHELKPNYKIPVGRILELPTRKTKLEIYLLDNCYELTGYHCSVSSNPKLLYTEPNGNKIGFCYISKSAYETWILESRHLAESSFMHELGHLMDKNFFDRSPSTRHAKSSRMEHLKKGKVDPCELFADEFAVQQVGLHAYLEFLDHMQYLRIKRNDEGAPIAIMEMLLRKKHLQNKFEK